MLGRVCAATAAYHPKVLERHRGPGGRVLRLKVGGVGHTKRAEAGLNEGGHGSI